MGESKQRLAMIIGSKLPRPLKILYYIVLFGTLVYILFLLLQWFLKTIRVIGEFVFKPQNYWSVVLCIFVLAIGTLIVSQFILGLDPIGNTWQWIQDLINSLRKW